MRWVFFALSVGILPCTLFAEAREQMEYDITWIGVSVGTMTVKSDSLDDGSILRSIRIQNRPWISAVYSVDNTIECLIEPTPEGPRHTVTKKMAEKNFTQDDRLVIWPEAGRAVWSNAVSNTVHEFSVPKGSRDFVSFFFDLREAAAGGQLKAAGNYQLVMDGATHALELKTEPPRVIRTPHGRIHAIRVQAISKSPTLFSRNRPKAVWVSAAEPAVLFADVSTRFATVRATLVSRTVDGKEVKIGN
jgi:hypothetical protein